MNIALDAMGCDHGPGVAVAGAVEAAAEYGITVSLVGRPEVIQPELDKHNTRNLNLPIVPAGQIIEMEDKPSKVIRSKPDSSMVVASQMVRNGEAQAFVTAGNTGGALAAGMFKIGRIKGILRPALITPYPTLKGICAVLDVGANADTKPEHMQQFAIMGNIYAKHVMNVASPAVRLLSNGEEAEKGNQLVLTAHKLLKQTGSIDFHGNIESREILEGLADVVVTDGFTGNVFLKTTEASAGALLKMMREELMRGPISSVGAFLAKAGLRRVRRRIDDSEYGGAVLLGLSGLVVVTHGRANANTIRHSIRIAKQGIEVDIPARIESGVAESTPETNLPEPVTH